MHCLDRPRMLEDALADLFDRARAGSLRVLVGGTYALADAAQAQSDIAARITTGKLLLDATL
jgi:NADPH2:quinone reductase